MLVMMEGKTYMIDGERLTFKDTRNNGEMILLEREDGEIIEIPLEDLIEKEIEEIK